MIRSSAARRRAWFAVERVQASAMDCGPACLASLLEGFGVQASYGRLREACRTDIDGTSVDAIESVAQAMGLEAEQQIIPVDHLLLRGEENLPALAVVRQADGPLHFVVLWRRVGPWLQVMDPATGRRWVTGDALLDTLAVHRTSLPAAEWCVWAASTEGLRPLRARLSALGIAPATTDELLAHAAREGTWFRLAALDASIRLTTQLARANGVRRGHEAARLVEALLSRTLASPDDMFAVVPQAYWTVVPDAGNTDLSHQRLLVSGCVILSVARAHGASPAHTTPLSHELAAAAAERPVHPLRTLWSYLQDDGLLRPLLLLGAVALATGTTTAEGLMFRGLFDIGARLSLGSQRLLGSLALLGFVALALAFHLPIVRESMRLGRRLDVRLRMALLAKLPHLDDRYFRSRPLSDLAERSHSIHLMRSVPAMGVHFVQTLCELALTLAGVVFLDPQDAVLAGVVAATAILVPALAEPVIAERDLRVRSHAGALSRFYLDALLGLVPIRAHGAQTAVRRQHESLLVEWVRASQRTLRAGIVASGAQGFTSTALCALLLLRHFTRAHGVTAADLLLVYWTLKLPTLGHTLTTLAQRYPAQRNILLRLIEPIAAPERTALRGDSAAGDFPARSQGHTASHIHIEQGHVVAAGHAILKDINLTIMRGEHVAIVGVSGAGKSTLLGLLLGWHRLASGRLLVDGRALDEAALETLRTHTAWVDPGVQIWNRSLLDNLTYSSADGDVTRTTAALDTAQLRGVLRSLPQGLQTALGEGGARLSGGEGQRVRLARALSQPDVSLALLDEPFRGLDREQRSRLLDQVRLHWRGVTTICVTHDVAETRGFDRVLVVEDGAIVEDGRPEHLVGRRSRYRELLRAEQRVHERLWKAPFWRRLRVDQGTVIERDTASERADLQGVRV